jgi:hypothetical protein
MNFLSKTVLYLFISTTMLIFGYEAVKFARDQVRITNGETLSRVIQYYILTEHRVPPSGEFENVSQFLFDRKLTDKMTRDPVFTSATVIMDQYALALIKIYDKLMKSSDIEKSEEIITEMKGRFTGIFEENEGDYPENIARLKALLADNQIQENLGDMKEVMNLSDSDLRELRKMLSEADLKDNINQIRELASQPIPPECVISYQSNNKERTFEISVKLESRFLMHRMREDGGNDDKRFEIGNDLQLNTAVVVYGSKIKARNRHTSIIR